MFFWTKVPDTVKGLSREASRAALSANGEADDVRPLHPALGALSLGRRRRDPPQQPDRLDPPVVLVVAERPERRTRQRELSSINPRSRSTSRIAAA
jgi:hypothetical protein